MIYFLLLTAFTVSIDSFICGFSLSATKKRLHVVLGITLTVFVMCLTVNYLSTFFADKLNQKTASIGGIILIAVGIYNLLNKKTLQVQEQNGLKQSIITGLAVGLDGALANLSLALMKVNQIYVPITIAIMHGVMIWLGTLLCKTKFCKKFTKIEFLPPIILILLGGYKLLGLFI